MIGTLILLCVAAIFLKIAVGLVGAGETENTFGMALLTSAILAGVGHFLGELDPGLGVRIAYVLSWLFVVKTLYQMGWFSAAMVGVVLAVVLTAVKFAIVATGVLSLAALGAFALLL